MDERYWVANTIIKDMDTFTELGSGMKLRQYQLQVAERIISSVIDESGMTFVVIFPRQSGKNELQAQIETYFLTLLQLQDVEMVKVSPTWKPQSLNAMRRLERVLARNFLTRKSWIKESGYIYRYGSARIFFLSGSPTTNVVGATANLLLQCDEAQDVQPEKWDKDFAPMAASTNATRVFWGTVWTSRTLLAREAKAAREAEKREGGKRVFLLNADQVAEEVPKYGKYVAEQVARLGRNHPLIKTQYFSEEINGEGGMFPKERQALMKGSHPKLVEPVESELYVMLLDLAGEDEGASEELHLIQDLRNPGRDSTALTVVRIDPSTLGDELIRAPRYEVVNRYWWTGVKHTRLYGQIKGLAELWRVRWLVVDATGVGAGMASFLDKALPGRVIPFIFTGKSKSDLGWDFLAVIETGRYKEYKPEPGEPDIQDQFWNQVNHCQSNVDAVPGRTIRWGVPDGTRDTLTGELVHDDLLISAAMCSLLDDQDWGIAESGLVDVIDPLEGMGEIF
jgi:hypothetical protein